MKGVAILGATGSIGQSTLAVLDQHPGRFRAVALTARKNQAGLAALVRRYSPVLAVLSGVDGIDNEEEVGTAWLSGDAALLEAATHPDVDIVVNALVGAAGLSPTLAALRSGKRVALANKESLVCGGSLVLDAARQGGGELIPVDSEHSAILQCIDGAAHCEIERIVLTASGGPFRGKGRNALTKVRPADALRHPTWDMGAKVTIDSATLANKALEIIEAHFLFGIGYDRIAAVVHPQSIVHSMVEMVDGSVIAQMGYPTMEVPIVYALAYPERIPYETRRYNPVEAGPLTFETLREDLFPAFALGVSAGRSGGAYPAIFNAANEIAVDAFLRERLGFTEISVAIAAALDQWPGGLIRDIESVLAADRWARETTRTFIEKHALC